MPDSERIIVRMGWSKSVVGGIAISAGCAVMLAFAPTGFAEYAAPLTLVGLALIAVGILLAGPALLRSVTGDKPESGSGDSYNNHGSNFGHMGPINNYGNQKLEFTPEACAALLQSLPDKKPIQLRTIGSQADQRIGSQFHTFLESQGFTVKRSSIGMQVPAPDNKITVDDIGAEYVVMISPSA